MTQDTSDEADRIMFLLAQRVRAGGWGAEMYTHPDGTCRVTFELAVDGYTMKATRIGNDLPGVRLEAARAMALELEAVPQ